MQGHCGSPGKNAEAGRSLSGPALMGRQITVPLCADLVEGSAFRPLPREIFCLGL